MSKVHLLCSTNWNPKFPDAKPEQMLGPLRTMLRHLAENNIELTRITLISGTHEKDREYGVLVLQELVGRGKVAVELEVDDSSAATVAGQVSRAADRAALDRAELWVDLTPGPKQRTAIFFAAASAVPNITIVYAESLGPDHYEVRTIPPLDSYNQWLGKHGILIRNYCDELRPLAETAEHATAKVDSRALLAAITDLLNHPNDNSLPNLSPRSNLLTLAEWVAKEQTPLKLSITSLGDTEVRGLTDEWYRSAGRAAQLAYQLRCLFAHPPRTNDYASDMSDAIALLDSLVFLNARLQSQRLQPVTQPPQAMTTPSTRDFMFIAVDGDDVGRRFEERLAICDSADQAEALGRWSQRMQQDLSEHMGKLMESWEGSFLARTGDGFLASFPLSHFQDVCAKFRPHLMDATVTVGIGRNVKEAYLALKLGKARNRGGGFFFSLNPSEESILWGA